MRGRGKIPRHDDIGGERNLSPACTRLLDERTRDVEHLGRAIRIRLIWSGRLWIAASNRLDYHQSSPPASACEMTYSLCVRPPRVMTRPSSLQGNPLSQTVEDQVDCCLSGRG